jgi:hypothetical protein
MRSPHSYALSDISNILIKNQAPRITLAINMQNLTKFAAKNNPDFNPLKNEGLK